MMSQQRIAHRYVLEFAGALAVYAALLAMSLLLLKGMPPNSPLRIPVALLPMIGGVLIVAVVVRQLGRVDELQRRTLLESIGFAFAGTAAITFGYGFLQTVGFPQLSWFAVWPIMAALWLLGSLVSARRYR